MSIKLSEIYTKEELQKGGPGSGRKAGDRVKVKLGPNYRTGTYHSPIEGKPGYHHVKIAGPLVTVHDKEFVNDDSDLYHITSPKNGQPGKIVQKADYVDSKDGNNPYLVKAFKDLEAPAEVQVRQSLADKLEKGTITKELHDSALAQLDNLLKAKGEGSRGGHVVGHTTTGKPVYATNSEVGHKGYMKDFTSKEHNEASKLHNERAIHHSNQEDITSGPQRDAHRRLREHHEKMAASHLDDAHKQRKVEHEATLSDDEKRILADHKKVQIAHHTKMHEFHSTMAAHARDLVGADKDLNAEYHRHKELAAEHHGKKESLEKE
jgi:hypothetical protein